MAPNKQQIRTWEWYFNACDSYAVVPAVINAGFFFHYFQKDIAAHLFNIGIHISGEITSFYNDIILLPNDVVIRLQVDSRTTAVYIKSSR